MSFRLAKQRDFRNNLKKESKQKIPLDSFKQHFYRQPALTEPFQYPEEYRKTTAGNEDMYEENSSSSSSSSSSDVANPLITQHSEVYELRQRLAEEQKERLRRLRMEAQIIDVYRVEDEVEDSFEALQKYFNDFVLHLRSADEEALQEQYRAARRGSVAYQHAILRNDEDSSMLQEESNL
jgi:hypothetical protein